MVIDFDIPGLPWDLALRRNGVQIPVRHPTELELEKIGDLRKGSREEARVVYCKIFSALTGIDPVEVAAVDPEDLNTFFRLLLEVIAKRLEFKHELRQRAMFAHTLPAAQQLMN